MFSGKRFTKEEALRKINHFCSYQERSHKEVIEKLYSYGLRKVEVDEIVATVIENNYLNEERFAKQYAGGKFRINHWGRKKIIYELQQKGVNKANIKIGLKEIKEDEYSEKLEKLAAKKWHELKGQRKLEMQAKLYAYLAQKGYEPALISTAIGKLVKDPGNQ